MRLATSLQYRKGSSIAVRATQIFICQQESSDVAAVLSIMVSQNRGNIEAERYDEVHRWYVRRSCSCSLAIMPNGSLLAWTSKMVCAFLQYRIISSIVCQFNHSMFEDFSQLQNKFLSIPFPNHLFINRSIIHSLSLILILPKISFSFECVFDSCGVML